MALSSCSETTKKVLSVIMSFKAIIVIYLEVIQQVNNRR